MSFYNKKRKREVAHYSKIHFTCANINNALKSSVNLKKKGFIGGGFFYSLIIIFGFI